MCWHNYKGSDFEKNTITVDKMNDYVTACIEVINYKISFQLKIKITFIFVYLEFVYVALHQQHNFVTMTDIKRFSRDDHVN